MSFNHVVVWIDHSQAHIIHFNPEAAEMEIIKTKATHPHLHVKAGVAGSGHAPEDGHYFDKVATSLKDSLEILLVGPGLEKLSLMKHLIKHQHAVSERVLSVETVDHPTDGQLLKYARRYFVRADNMR